MYYTHTHTPLRHYEIIKTSQKFKDLTKTPQILTKYHKNLLLYPKMPLITIQKR